MTTSPQTPVDALMALVDEAISLAFERDLSRAIKVKVAVEASARALAAIPADEAERIEADEALMRQALDVFEEGRDALQERANRYHDEMRGYYPDEHKAMDQDVVRADAAITALRKRLESSNGL